MLGDAEIARGDLVRLSIAGGQPGPGRVRPTRTRFDPARAEPPPPPGLRSGAARLRRRAPGPARGAGGAGRAAGAAAGAGAGPGASGRRSAGWCSASRSGLMWCGRPAESGVGLADGRGRPERLPWVCGARQRRTSERGTAACGGSAAVLQRGVQKSTNRHTPSWISGKCACGACTRRQTWRRNPGLSTNAPRPRPTAQRSPTRPPLPSPQLTCATCPGQTPQGSPPPRATQRRRSRRGPAGAARGTARSPGRR